MLGPGAFGCRDQEDQIGGAVGCTKSTFGSSRANPRDADETASARQWGIAIPPGSPVADCASRASAASTSPAASLARPAAVNRAAENE